MHHQLSKTIARVVVFLFIISGPAQAYTSTRVVPTGKLEVYRNGELVQVLQEEAPLPGDAVLKAIGQCGVRAADLLLVVEDGSTFSLDESGDTARLNVEKGQIFFGVNQQTGPIMFSSPQGEIDLRQVVVAESTGTGMLKGYLEATGETLKFGVLEGGSMTVMLAQGEKTIAAGESISIPEQAEKKKSKAVYIAGGSLLGLLALVALGGGGGGGGDDSPKPVSPASP